MSDYGSQANWIQYYTLPIITDNSHQGVKIANVNTLLGNVDKVFYQPNTISFLHLLYTQKLQLLQLVSALLSLFSLYVKGRVERIFFFASFKLPLFNEYEMVFIIA